MYRYRIRGNIYPAQFPVSVGEYVLESRLSQGAPFQVSTRFKIAITNSVVTVTADSDRPWPHPAELLSHCETLIQTMLNAMAFVTAILGNVFLYSVALQDEEVYRRPKSLLKGVDFPDTLPPDLFGRIMSVKMLSANNEHGYQIDRALDNYRLALQNQIDTGFLCYRAIECLRVYCHDAYGIEMHDKKTGWMKFRDISGVGEDEIRGVQKHADATRHGNFKGISALERSDVLSATHSILHRFFLGEFGKQKNRIT